MEIKLKTSFSEKKTLLLILLSFICVFLGLLSCVLGELVLPVLVGALALLFLLDKVMVKPYGIVVSIILLTINAVGVIFQLIASFFAPCAIILASILVAAFRKRSDKANTSYIMTLICAGFTVLSCILLGMIAQGEYTLEAAETFYTEFFEELREVIITAFDQVTEIYNQAGIELVDNAGEVVFDVMMKMMISTLLIGAFALVGLSMKFFKLGLFICLDDKNPLEEWRFNVSSILAYGYLFSAIISIFTSNADNLFAVTVMNLESILFVVFAYVGFNAVVSLLMKKMKRVFATLIVIGAIITFSTFAVQLLAVFGAMYTLRINRMKKAQES